MAEPSNIRINPFTGTGGATNYVELTEKHIVPANSPYVIRLNEVPEKQDPSNIKMVYVDSATGTATSTTLTEVAATPGQGEFRMDYTTNAMEDKTWNTGLVEFSAADAGKIIEVTYTGTGTLAAVNSNHWPSWYTDRGDGSDGDFVPTGNTTISGVKNYKSVFIKAGLTVTCSSNTWIKCQGIFINRGSISVTPCGGIGGKGTDSDRYGKPGGSSGLYGASGGVGGGCSWDGRTVGGAGGASLTRIKPPLPMIVVGCGGGSGSSSDESYGASGKGGNGGGSITITASMINNSNGKIYAKGENGEEHPKKWDGGGGGGGGGSILLVAHQITKGITDSSGGLGGESSNTNYNGASGEDGLVFVKELGVL